MSVDDHEAACRAERAPTDEPTPDERLADMAENAQGWIRDLARELQRARVLLRDALDVIPDHEKERVRAILEALP